MVPGLVLLLGLGVWAMYVLWRVAGNETRPARQVTSPLPVTAIDPLSIAGLRGHHYEASQIRVDNDIGDAGGYKNSIVSYQSDGLKVYAMQSTPGGKAPGEGWPVVILCHGYIDPAQYRTDGPEYTELIAAYTKAGYVVLKPDYRGHGRSEGQPTGGHYSPDYAYDVINLIDSIKADKRFNGKRIGLVGHSMGGHVALRAIVVSPDVKATVMLAGVVGSVDDIYYNWPGHIDHDDKPTDLVQGIREKLVKKHGEPKKNPAYWNSVSAVNYVEAVTGAVQIQQSDKDSVVPKLFADRLAEALRREKKRLDYQVYPGDDHQFVANRSRMMDSMMKFLRENL